MIFNPQDRHELAVWLRERQAPVAIRGASSCSASDELILSGLNRVIVYEPGEMIVQVEAGLTIAELDALLASNSQWIPTLQPAEDDSTTIGGALSRDVYHPRTRRHTPLRTTVLGGTFCTTDGVLFRSGSRVVKSVAGYDTHRAFVGADGRFGVIVDVTLRVFPRPEAFYRFSAPLERSSTLAQEAPSILESNGEELLVEVSGYSDDVNDSVGRLSASHMSLSGGEWRDRILKIRRSKPRQSAQASSMVLRSRLEEALDPKGVLRG